MTKTDAQNWTTIKLSDICDVVSGSTPSTGIKKYWGDGYSLITPLDLSKKHRYLSRIEFRGRDITVEGFSSCSIVEIPRGSVVMSSRAPIGYLTISKLNKATTNQGCKSFIIKDKSKVDSEFLYYRILKDINKIKRLGSGSTFLEVSKKDLEKFEISIPSISEQRNIAQVLSRVDDDIEKTSKIIKQTEKLKKGLMQELFTNGIGHKKFKKTKIGIIPEKWNITNLKEISEIITKGTTPTTYGHKFINEGVNFIKIECINDGKVDLKKCKHISDETNNFLKRSQLEEADVLFSIAGALGRTAIIKEKYLPANTNQAVAIIRLRDKRWATYIEKSLNADYVINQINNSVVQLAQANISLGQLGKILLAMPREEEMNKIIRILSKVDRKIDIYKSIKLKLVLLKNGLMQDLLCN